MCDKKKINWQLLIFMDTILFAIFVVEYVLCCNIPEGESAHKTEGKRRKMRKKTGRVMQGKE
jgi:hypothetical protein